MISKFMRRASPLLAVGALMLGAMDAAAQPAPNGPPPAAPSGGPDASSFFGPPPEPVAFPAASQAYGQDPAKYTRQEADAVEITKEWMDAWDKKDLKRLMGVMDKNVQFRADPIEELQFGDVNFCHVAAGVIGGWSGLDLQELYVVGDEWDTSVLARRIDYFPPGASGFAGIHVDVAFYLRIKNGKIIEWLDAPTVPIGPSALALQGITFPAIPAAPAAVEACKYLEKPGYKAPARVPVERVGHYGTNKPQNTWSGDERIAANTVLAWVYANDPQKRAQFMDPKVMWRTNPAGLLQHGLQGYIDFSLNSGWANDPKPAIGDKPRNPVPTGPSPEVRELYVVGGPYDNLVLTLRIDPAQGTREQVKDYGGLPVAALYRVQNFKVTEVYDAPITKFGTAASGDRCIPVAGKDRPAECPVGTPPGAPRVR